jgi:hypothetical protein
MFCGLVRTDITTHTYIFVDEVARQGRQPPGWPSDWGYDSEVGGMVPADYEMDPPNDGTWAIFMALLTPGAILSMLPNDFISPARALTHPQRGTNADRVHPAGR